jgi:hypothetical protein
MKPQMTKEAKPRIANIVQIGILQRRLALAKAPTGRKVIQAKIAFMTDALGVWVQDGQLLSQQVQDGFEAEGVDLGILDARFVRLLRDKNERESQRAHSVQSEEAADHVPYCTAVRQR